MVKKNGLDLGTTLVFTGAYNVLTGFLFGIPMAVQPMKTIAAVALSERALTAAQIAFAGMAVSFVVILLGVTGLVNHFNRLIPQELIRGTQLGLGVKLAMSGVASVLYTDGDKSEGWLPFAAYDGLLMGSLFFLFVLLSSARNDAADRADSSAKPAPPGGDAGAPGPPTHGCCAVVLHLPSDSTVDRTTPPVPPTTYALERHATHAADARSTGADGKADREGLAEGGEAGDVRREMVVREEGKDRGMSVGSQTMSHGGKETASVTATGSSSGRASWLRLPRRIPAALICSESISTQWHQRSPSSLFARWPRSISHGHQRQRVSAFSV